MIVEATKEGEGIYAINISFWRIAGESCSKIIQTYFADFSVGHLCAVNF
jgi:hypothetical protein